MKLVISQYLASLRERDELDAILPDLLSELGFEVLTRPRRGTRQHGVDVAAVGPDPGENERRSLFLFTVKSGDFDRQTWNGGQQAVRQSIEDALDGYVPHRIPEQYADLPIAICLCMGGEMREDLRDTWTGFTSARENERIRFREWPGDRLARLLMTGVLRQDLLRQASSCEHGRSATRCAPTRRRCGRTVAHSSTLFLPAVAVAEAKAGICKLRRLGAAARADRLSAWLDAVLGGYGDRILPLDAGAARTAGRLSDAVLAKGHDPGFADVAIAAVAAAHGLFVLARNLRHFAVQGVPYADPLDTLPP